MRAELRIMQKPSLVTGALIGAVTSLPIIALFYLGDQLAGLPFVPFNLFDWLARVLPGNLVTLGIDTLVLILTALNVGVRETAKFAEQMMAIGLVVLSGAFLGLVVALLLRRSIQGAWRTGAIVASIFFLIVSIAVISLGMSGNPLIVFLWLLLVIIGWGAILGYTIELVSSTEVEGVPVDQARRDALLKVVGGSVGLALGAWGLARLSQTSSAQVADETGAAQPLSNVMDTRVPEATTQATFDFPPTPSGRIAPVPGTRAEITSNEEFYRIDINTRPPVIDGNGWQLEIAGLFNNPRPLTLSDLMAFPAVTQPLTLSCISNRVGGDLIGSSYWTGARLRDVLEDLQLQPEAGALYIEAADGFYETVTAEDMMDERTLLVYGMNGETLPIEHGYPLRIFIPNRYGMKQPKWMVRMEAVEAWLPGYWVERGWSREARPQIVSVIDTIAVDAMENGVVPIGGIAWAGDRGIQKVEIQIGDSEWIEVELRKPPLSALTWVQWRYDWLAEPGQYTITVRATDGTGTLQTTEHADPHPDGATGYHSMTTTI